ncbi:exodeoxyribonuclease III [Pseudofulvimonas gallinarii]|uniref:Exodeoxyribonuclease III n=1 Tax=Pseudofulvimonas gallinarii TaxID=634155 RepID=A0A4R3L466_9GAMM|nr:exodeoxyribonuclease III [Pseudofulvimonas gallinarii]TCS93748.1 exodeoxyribonuclease III [Pseudofulvimonas gallinarii]THD13280.1 exodeoxyribonuclease III [Pseudofulvimonas gallinarii]
MKIASWNVNSLKVRLPHLQQWCADAAPDILALQETKSEDGAFPLPAIQALGYHCVFSGQRTYNGVAILAREAPTDVVTDVAGLDDPQRRFLAATVGGLRIVNLYVVNGQSVGSEKYAYKLRWLDAVTAQLREELARHPELVVLGDFNIAPEDRDVHDPEAWREQILCSTPEREALRAMLDLGLHDSFRLHNDEPGQYSWWDYRQAAFRRDLGLRIDLVLVSESLKARVADVGIDRVTRTWERPSDHAPAWVRLSDTTS